MSDLTTWDKWKGGLCLAWTVDERRGLFLRCALRASASSVQAVEIHERLWDQAVHLSAPLSQVERGKANL